MSENIPEIFTEYSPDYKRIIVGDVYGSIDSIGLQAIVYSEHKIIDEVLKSVRADSKKTKIKRVIECELVLDPQQMIAVYKWLETKIKEYEEVFGEIAKPEQIKERAVKLYNLEAENQS
jgi:hypothetical protein